MKRCFLIPYLLLIVIFFGCEKVTIEDVKDSSGQQNNGQQTTGSTTNADLTGEDWLTVAEAQEADIDEVICVRGYIVASCVRSMKNADFLEPFEGSTAIILAEEPVDIDYFQYETDDDLFPVCLTDYKDKRAALNLEDNPELWNRRVLILGTKARYMSVPGMKKVLAYQVLSD